MTYVPNKCATCGKDIFPHWKYCQEHTRGNILLDMDNVKGVPLARQAQARMEIQLDALKRVYDAEFIAHQQLKEQYALLQENYHKLIKHGIATVLMERLSTPTPQDFH